MAIPDVHEDTATMGAMAMQLIDRNGLDRRTIGRMYLGTESPSTAPNQRRYR